MKYIWTEDDIICGWIVCKPDHEFSKRKNPIERGFKASGWTAKWTHKIGWLAGGNPLDKERTIHNIEGRADYCMIAMTDGMIGNPRTKKEIVNWLNKEKMIPMPHSWWLATVEFLRDCYSHYH